MNNEESRTIYIIDQHKTRVHLLQSFILPLLLREIGVPKQEIVHIDDTESVDLELFYEAVDQGVVALVLLDHSFNEVSKGIEIAQNIRTLQPRMPIIGVSHDPEQEKYIDRDYQLADYTYDPLKAMLRQVFGIV